MEINWRAARIKTDANDLIVIPNSVFAKAIVVNHRALSAPHEFPIALTVSHLVSPARVLATLEAAALGCPGLAPGTTPKAYAGGFLHSAVTYELSYAVDDFTRMPIVQSALVTRVADACLKADIVIGLQDLTVRLAPRAASSERPVAGNGPRATGWPALSRQAPP